MIASIAYKRSVHVRESAGQMDFRGGWVKRPQYRKLLLQIHVALESHGLAARARLASTENVFIGL